MDDEVRKTSSRPEDCACLPYLLTVSEVADLLRTTNKAIYSMVDRAKLPGVVRIGKRLLFRRDDLLYWIDRRALSHKEVVR